jgi:hypothetical protein
VFPFFLQVNGQTAATEAALTIDETKFLGGDVEHTHLVKGLDYALLAKVSSQLPCIHKIVFVTPACVLRCQSWKPLVKPYNVLGRNCSLLFRRTMHITFE